jgi:DNA-binding transcriptional LysR family regulator
LCLNAFVIELSLLLQFAAVAERLSFTAAARQLGIGQPRLSAQIRKLEMQLGTALFERSTRRVELTADGEELLRVARPYSVAANDAREALARLSQRLQAIVRIGCPQLGAPDLRQAELISSFSRHYPGVTIETIGGQSENHVEAARRGNLDLALVLGQPCGDEWDAAPLHRLAFAAILHASDPLASLPPPLQPHHFAGRRVAGFVRRRVPELFDRLYGPMVAAGAKLIEVPELRRSLLQADEDLIVTTIVPAPADGDLRHRLVRRAIVTDADLRVTLVRLRGRPTGAAAERFWQWGQRAAMGA